MLIIVHDLVFQCIIFALNLHKINNVSICLRLQGVFMMYLYVGSIVAIMCIYISVLIDNCPSLTNSNGSRENLTTKGDPEVGSIASFGTLRKAHIDRTKVSRTSFYLRVGALGKKH